MDKKVRDFKSELIKKMYRLQDEVNRLHADPRPNLDEMYRKEKEIANLFLKLRRVLDQEQKKR